MSRYRKVQVRTWGDEKFRELSPIPPCGQGLWLFLITGPHTGPIPGLFRAGRAAMAEDLGWEIEDFDKAFDEAFQQGMVKADFKARVVWIPQAIKHNKPESPNVVRSWGAEFDLIPECNLKAEAFEHLQAFIHGIGEGFAKAFDEAFGKAYTKPSGKGIANQEQEQEQEQEQKKESNPDGLLVDSANDADDLILTSPGATTRIGPPDCPHQQIIALYHEILPMCPGIREWTPNRAKALQTRWKEDPKRQTIAYWRRFFEYIAESEFLTGRARARDGTKPFTASLDWIVKAENFAKIREGRYHHDQEAA